MDPYDTDLLEYHTVAVNFAKGNIFPVMGFMYNTETYRVRNNYNDSVPSPQNFSTELFKSTGTTVFLRKPPFYGLALGIIYKCFGVDIRFVYAFNLLLLSFIAGLLPYAGFKHGRLTGFICGCIAALIFLFNKVPDAFKIDPETLLSFWIFLIFILSITLKNNDRPLKHLFLGVFFALALLTKGSILFIPLFYLAYVLVKSFYKKYKLKNIFFTAIGLFITLLPWVISANYLRLTTVNQRATWNEQNLSLLNQLGNMQNQPLFRNGKINPVIVEYILRNEYSTYAQANSFIVITPQAEGDQVLAYHNELCTDGWWHPDWRFRKDLFYNNHYANENPWLKVVHFYKGYPSLFFEIALAKLKNVSDNKFPFFWLATSLFGICIIQKKALGSSNPGINRVVVCLLPLVILPAIYFLARPPNIASIVLSLLLFLTSLVLYRSSDEEWCPVIVPVAILNFLLVTFIVFSGDPGFVQAIDFISIYFSIFFTIRFLSCYLKQLRESLL